MDNGLIFPYRLYRDPAEAEDAKRPNPLRPSGKVEEHANRIGSRQAMG